MSHSPQRPPRRGAQNDKRRIAAANAVPAGLALPDQVTYGGNPEHKRNPGDFGLSPPAAPRADKTLCDAAGITQRAEALRLLREGLRRGLVSPEREGPFPKRIWSVSESGFPLEARLDNAEQGNYHGYPLDTDDCFRQEVLRRWQ